VNASESGATNGHGLGDACEVQGANELPVLALVLVLVLVACVHAAPLASVRVNERMREQV